MNKKKTYGVFGLNEYSTIIPCGNSYLRIEFTDGSMSVRGVEPAKFTTSNEVVQAAIESSEKFLKGRIKLISSVPVSSVVVDISQKGTVAEESGTASSSSSSSMDSYPSVVNSQQAKEVLRSEPYNVSLSELGNKADIQNKAKELGVSFPNWN